ncbi:Hsp70 family protein [Terracidiphilus gabretensis]|uniref:Hsp70 family protein n=1 Tax=Terracidiphilus gabretensis TaxID=1577687 RepID=UPI00071B6BD9|nr:Hsp70 family protein [Terracidiphilus gabretensis]
MAEARICESCQAWLCAPQDAWCGYCGSSCARLDVIARPSILVAGEIAPKIGIRLFNPTLSQLSIVSVHTPQWMIIEPCIGQTVAPGEQCLLWAEASTYGFAEPQSGEIAIATTLGPAAAAVSIIDEHPAIVCTPQEVEVWTSQSQTTRQITIELAPSGGDLVIHSVNQGPSGGLNVITALKQPFRASPERRLALTLNAKSEVLVKKSYASLTVRFEGAHGLRETEVKIGSSERKPPQITWADGSKAPETRFQTGGQTLRLVLRNQADHDPEGGRGNAKLVVKSAVLTPPQNCPAAIVQLQTKLPIEILGGNEGALEFSLNLEGMKLAQQELFHFDLDVEANIPVARRRVPLFIRPLPFFDGVLAIDFGSSNTTSATVETGRDLEMIPLDHQQPVSPTYIQYVDLSTAVPEVRIGSEVKTFAAIDEDESASTLSGLKQKLGEPNAVLPVRPKKSADWMTRSVSLAAADYLHEIRRTAESQRKAIFRDFIFTHPAVCSLDQFRNLNWAVRQAFGEANIRLLQEPVAAVIPLITDLVANPKTPGHDFTVASFDLGGGTTDIAILIVHREYKDGSGFEIQPRIANSQGVRFGGEDLTAYLEERLLANCNLLLSSRMPGFRVVQGWISGVSQGATFLNKSALHEAAEYIKESLSREAKKDQSSRAIDLHVYSEEKRVARYESFSIPDLIAAGGRNLCTDFIEHAREKIDELAQLLLRCTAEVLALDYIHLSGKTSLLPVVEETIRKAFPKVTIIPARNPKECVVAGACLSISMRSGTARRLVLPSGAQRTTSSIGVFDVVTRLFRAILPVNTEVPVDGLLRELPGYWFGEEKIALWENLALSGEDIDSALSKKLLTKLGTWIPERSAPSADSKPWTLRLVLKDFQLKVSAIGPRGEQIAFHREGEDSRPKD